MTARSQTLQGDELVGGDGPLIVNGLPERVHDTPDQGVAHRHAHNAAGTLDLVAFFDLGVFAEQHHAHLILFKVHGNAGYAMGEGKKFSGHDFIQAVHPGNAIAKGDNGARLIHRDFRLVVLDLLADQLGNFVCLDLCHRISDELRALSREQAAASFDLLTIRIARLRMGMARSSQLAAHRYELIASLILSNCPFTEPS